MPTETGPEAEAVALLEVVHRLSLAWFDGVLAQQRRTIEAQAATVREIVRLLGGAPLS